MGEQFDCTRRTYAKARRIPAWQRLIDTVHKAQAAKGHDGRQWGKAGIEHFNATAVGIPVERVQASPSDFAAYWVERTVFEHLDGTASATYRLKAVYGDDLANVHTIADESAHNPSAEWEDAAALDMVRRAHYQTGVES